MENFEKKKLKNPGDQVIVAQFNVLRAQLLFSSFVTACASSGVKGNEWGLGWFEKKKEKKKENAASTRRSISLRWGGGSISANVIWHSTQRRLHGADDSAKPCLWRLHAWRCWAVIWSSHAKRGRLGRVGWQTGSSQSAKSDTQAAAAEGASAGTTKHLYLLKDSTIAP